MEELMRIGPQYSLNRYYDDQRALAVMGAGRRLKSTRALRAADGRHRLHGDEDTFTRVAESMNSAWFKLTSPVVYHGITTHSS